MKKLLMTCATSTLIMTSSMAKADVMSWVEETEISGNVGLASDYLFYGASQTAGGFKDGGPAISGGFDLALPFEVLGGQFYIGTWASNVEWGGTNDQASIEFDYYGGIAGDSIGTSGISWDLGVWRYSYPYTDVDAGANAIDYVEVYGNLGYTFEDAAFTPSISVGMYYSDDYFGTDESSIYIPFGVDVALPMDFGMYFGGGYFDLDGAAGGDYVHYSVGVTKTVMGVDLDLSWNGNDDQCGVVQGTNCGGIVFGASQAF